MQFQPFATADAIGAGAGSAVAEPGVETLWHVTLLSNFARAYDKYSRCYAKAAIPESRYPDRFFLLRRDELGIGIAKAKGLLARLALPGDRLIALQTRQPSQALQPNLRTGLGRFIASDRIRLSDLAFVDDDGALMPTTTEEASALALLLVSPQLMAFEALAPRSLSLLPIAQGCQASCPFCFSDASASAEQDQGRLDLDRLRAAAQLARRRGAERFVVTGGGEPGLLRHDRLCAAIRTGREVLGKAVLISNGHHLARQKGRSLDEVLDDYEAAGLDVLALSRHHWDDGENKRLMRLDTDVAAIAAACARRRRPELRFVCVLQQGAVDSMAALAAYLDWAVGLGVAQFCFKELYVSTSAESVYHDRAANAWSRRNQVPLAIVPDFAASAGLVECDRLPWGSPIFAGHWRGQAIRIAAYTESSLFWERSTGLARSWNLMSDGRCLVSLEDRRSEIDLAAA